MAEGGDAPADLAARLDATGRLLVRSGIEVAHTLEAMRCAGDSVSAELDSEEHLFISRLLEVDGRNGTLTIAWSPSKPANADLMDRRSITFSANHRGLHLQFVVGGPRETDFGNQPAIQLDLPTAMLVLQRRALPRYRVPQKLPLSCEIFLGPMSFNAKVVDVSLGGMGAIVYDAGIRLSVGMIIRRASILIPSHAPVLVALEVRHIGTVTLADGTVASRAGCRFIAPGGAIEALIGLFVTALEAEPGRVSGSRATRPTATPWARSWRVPTARCTRPSSRGATAWCGSRPRSGR